MRPGKVHILILGALLGLALLSILSAQSTGHQGNAAGWALGVIYLGGAFAAYAVVSSLGYVLVSRRIHLSAGRVLGIDGATVALFYCILYLFVEVL